MMKKPTLPGPPVSRIKVPVAKKRGARGRQLRQLRGRTLSGGKCTRPRPSILVAAQGEVIPENEPKCAQKNCYTDVRTTEIWPGNGKGQHTSSNFHVKYHHRNFRHGGPHLFVCRFLCFQVHHGLMGHAMIASYARNWLMMRQAQLLGRMRVTRQIMTKLFNVYFSIKRMRQNRMSKKDASAFPQV